MANDKNFKIKNGLDVGGTITSGGVAVGGATTIDGLTDVDTSTVAPTDGQVLAWDNTASKWEPATSGGGGGGIGSFTSTSIAISSDSTALANDDGTSNNNIGMGGNALAVTSTGVKNIALGVGSLATNLAGNNNVGIGSTTAYNAKGSNNIGIGEFGLRGGSTFSGSYNTGIGKETGYNLTTGQYNVLNGYQAGYNLTTGSSNVAIGNIALRAATTVSTLIAIGNGALTANTSGTNNIALGNAAMEQNTAGGKNIVLGTQAGWKLQGSNNVAIGHQALRLNTSTASNTAVGYQALYTSTGGTNIGIGSGAGASITTGANNTIIGGYAGTPTLADTVAIYAGLTERIKVDASGMTVNGAAVGGGGAWETISTSTISSTVSAIDVEYAFSSTYKAYKIIYSGLTASGNGTPQIRFKIGGSYLTSGYKYMTSYNGSNGSGFNATRSASGGYIYTMYGMKAGAGYSGNLEVTIYNPESTSLTKQVNFFGSTYGENDFLTENKGVGTNTSVGALQGLRLYSGGNFTAGTVTLIGLK